MSLEQSLRDLALESGEIVPDESFVGAEEITVITDETQSELEEAVAETAEEVDKLSTNDANAEKVIEAVESLESLSTQLTGLAAKGEKLSGAAVQFYISAVTASLEARSFPVEIFGNDVMGLQQSFESASVEDYTAEAEEKTGNILTRLYNMLATVVRAAVAAVKTFIASIGKSASAITAGGNKLKKIASGLKGAPKEGDILGGWVGALALNGSVNAVGALKKVEAAYTNVSALTNKIQSGMSPLITALANPTPAGVTSAAAGLNTAFTATTIDLPGNAKATFTPGSGEGIAKLTGAKFSITKEKGNVSKAAPLSAAEIGALGSELVAVGTLLGKASADANKATANNEKVLAAADKAVKASKDGDAAAIGAARDLIKQAQAAIKANKNIMPAFISYTLGVAKEAYRFGTASAGKYGAKVEAEGKEGKEGAKAEKDAA